MNGYVCFTTFSCMRLEVHAATSYEAQQKAQRLFQNKFPHRKVKSSQVSVHLAEEEVV